MGIIICEKHGQAGIVEPCKHVAKEIDNKRYGKFYHAGTLLVCEDCLKKYNLERFVDKTLPGEILEDDDLLEEFFDVYEVIEGKTVRCSE